MTQLLLDRSFEPVYQSDAKLLILGSLPGKRSIVDQRYYAHPRNAFWPIMSDLIGVDANAPYQERLRALMSKRIALWDVASAAERPGSLDSSIRKETLSYNAIPVLLANCPEISAILFNGAASEKLFKDAQKSWSQAIKCPMERMPSTSPANAGLSLEQKRKRWLNRVYWYLNESS